MTIIRNTVTVDGVTLTRAQVEEAQRRLDEPEVVWWFQPDALVAMVNGVSCHMFPSMNRKGVLYLSNPAFGLEWRIEHEGNRTYLVLRPTREGDRTSCAVK